MPPSAGVQQPDDRSGDGHGLDQAAWSLRDFVEATPSSMAMFDTSMRYLAVSPQYLIDNNITETQQSIVGRSIFEFRRDSENAREVNRRVLSGETVVKDDFRLGRPDGSALWMRWQMQPWRMPDGSVGGAVLLMEILQAKTEAEERLAASESMLRLSQEAGRIGSYDWAIGGSHNYWSDEHCRLFGIEPSGGKSVSTELWQSIIHPDDLPAVLQKIAEIVETGGSSEIEHRIVGPNGVRWLHGRGQLLREPGKPTRLIGINMDVTERRALEDNLRELTRTLEQRVEQEVSAKEAALNRLAHAQKIQSIGELTGGVAHDFNNLLTVITGSVDTLADGVADRPELASIVKLIESAADRGAKLTSNLLAFARKQPLQPRSTDVAALIAAAGDLLVSALGKQIEVNCVKRGDIGTVLVDPDQLTAAIVNLGINARDAMPDGGRLTIDADTVVIDEDGAAVREIAARRYVSIRVEDTGRGIDKAIQDRVFEPFFSTKEVGKGTGLGLSMVYGFAKQSGGHVEFETRPGRGTTFTLYIPATAQMPLPVQLPTSAIPGGHETILCIEDDAAVREFVVQQLQRLGYRTITATNAAEALAEVRQGTPIDLVFTDIIMPGSTDGWKLAELIRQIRPDMKILYTTGYSDVSSERMRSVPGTLLLKKPYRFSTLAQMIRRALGDSTAG
ncbi:MAG: ATP-binding protein [Bradyrhizobium sp.]